MRHGVSVRIRRNTGPIRGAELSSAKIFVENYEGVRVKIVPSDFDYTQRFVGSYLWDLPNPGVAARSQVGAAGSFCGLQGSKAPPNCGRAYHQANRLNVFLNVGLAGVVFAFVCVGAGYWLSR